jgi:uncharacterized protein
MRHFPISTPVGTRPLNEAKMPFGVLMVVDEELIQTPPARLLEYVKTLGIEGIGFLNAVPENTTSSHIIGSYVPWPDFVNYLREVFRVWWSRYRGDIVVRDLADLAAKVAGGRTSVCVFAGNCMGNFLTVEPNGDVAACDKCWPTGDPSKSLDAPGSPRAHC